MALLLALLELPSASASIDCFACGFRNKCPLPFKAPDDGDDDDEESEDDEWYEPDENAPAIREGLIEKISCPDACVKFDGTNDDGDRVIMRGCVLEDYALETNTCREEYEWFGAQGTICHCNAENCNGAGAVGGGVVVLLAGVVAAVAVML